MKPISLLLLSITLSGAVHAALPGDAAEGQRLHDVNCLKCHDAGVYAKERRQIRSLDALRERIGGCTHMAGADFSPEQSQSVLKYLNERFYRLP
ncbi:MAG TPA: hypothetical protein VIS73_02100 [Rhodocyclaceae bacterium]